MTHKTQLKITAMVVLLFCAGGAVLIYFGYGEYADSREFAGGAETAEGDVTGFEVYDDPASLSERDNIYYAMIRYTTEDGREIIFRGPSKHGLVKLKQGDSVRVLYYPEEPKNARVDSFMGLWFVATMLIGLGVGAILIPLLTLWQCWKWVKRQES